MRRIWPGGKACQLASGFTSVFCAAMSAERLIGSLRACASPAIPRVLVQVVGSRAAKLHSSQVNLGPGITHGFALVSAGPEYGVAVVGGCKTIVSVPICDPYFSTRTRHDQKARRAQSLLVLLPGACLGHKLRGYTDRSNSTNPPHEFFIRRE